MVTTRLIAFGEDIETLTVLLKALRHNAQDLPTWMTRKGLKQRVATIMTVLQSRQHRCTDWALADHLGIPRKTVWDYVDTKTAVSTWIIETSRCFR